MSKPSKPQISPLLAADAAPAAPPSPNRRTSVDWEAIELDYRAGIKTLRQIGEEQGVTHVAINKRAKRDSWSRDLAAKIRAKADELVTKSLVTSSVTKEGLAAERSVIDANAEAIKQVRLGHRTDIQRGRRILMALFGELEQQTGAANVALLEELGELLRKEDDKGVDKLNDLYRKIISLPARAKTMKDLGETLRVMVAMERQAFGLDDKDALPIDPLTSLLHSIAKNSGNSFQPVAVDVEHDED